MKFFYISMTLLLGSLNARAVCEQFSPFEAGQGPKPFPVVALTNIWQDTDQLTAEQRERLWLKEWDRESKSFGKPMFPHPEVFAAEQGKPTNPPAYAQESTAEH